MQQNNNSNVLQKKVCLLGAFGVGKTSLTRRYVYSIFSDNYLTTVGVKIDKKTLDVAAQQVTLLIWDIAGEDEASSVQGYLRGAAGYLLVVDASRAQTLAVARSIQSRVQDKLGDIPFLCLLNKTDLPESEWDLAPARVDALAAEGWTVLRTSAKTGTGVDEAFSELAQRMLR